MQHLGKEVPTRTSRIPDAERQALLDRLDAQDAANPHKQRRGLPRVGFRKCDVSCRIYHPGGTVTNGTVATRNLSEGGISFLYNGYLHAKTKVEIVLHRRLGGVDTIYGTVQHCALVQRTYHLVGVKFNAKIFPKLYVDPAEWAELADSSNVDAKTLSGTVLHLDEEELDRVLLGHFIKGTRINLLSSASLDDAKAQLAKNKIDAVLLDLTIGGTPVEKAIGVLRDAGFSGPVAALTAETDPKRLEAVQTAGIGAVLGKPYDANNLLSLLATWLTDGANGDEPLTSSMADQESMKPLISQYVGKVQIMAREIRKKFDANDLPGARQHLMSVRGTGKSFGFALLSDLARDAVATIDEQGTPQDCKAALERFEQACRRVKAA